MDKEEKELVARKMIEICKKIDAGKIKLFTEEQVKKKYGFK